MRILFLKTITFSSYCQLPFELTCLHYLYRIIYHYNDDPNTPVYDWATNVKTLKEVLPILLMQPNPNKTCTRIPTSVSDDVCFLLDTTKLKCQQDWKCDDMGAWKNNGVQRQILSTPISEEEPLEENPTPCAEHSLKRIYLKNKSSPDLKKFVSFLEGKSNRFSIRNFRPCISFVT